MPPPDSGKSLDSEQLATLRAWIEEGAEWETHWAFSAPERPEVPTVAHADWPRNPIDSFVLASLESTGWAPSSEADRTTWIRRVTLDLIGLPPTVEEVDAFVADSSPRAKTKVVERLLESPHFGERWGRLWLDAARYADSDGYEKDKPREVWFYRDWVIGALNGDMPYDTFIERQIAGDLAPNASQADRVATGFLRNSMINEEGGVDPEQFRMEAMFDRMDAVGKAVLGLTINCAQCHTHKYDPLTQRDYYRMFAYLNNSYESQVSVYTEGDEVRRSKVLAGLDQLETDWKAEHPGWETEFDAWRQQALSIQGPDWEVASLTFNDSTIGGQKFLPQPDGSYLAQSYAPTKFRPEMVFTTELKQVTAVRLELMTDPNLPRSGPGRSVEGTAALSEFTLLYKPEPDAEEWSRAALGAAVADVNPAEMALKPIYDDRGQDQRITGPIGFAVDGDEKTAWTTDVGYGRSNVDREAVFVFETPIESPSHLKVWLSQKHGGWNSDDNQTYNLGRFRLSLTDASEPRATSVPIAIREALAREPNTWTAEERRMIFEAWLATRGDSEAVIAMREELWSQHPRGSTQLVLNERMERRPTHVLSRGDFLNPKETVEPGVPDFLHALQESDAPQRLRFARWLASREAPTTARAYVNRVWQAFFGVGLVETPDDLGLQGAAPSHSELLDWLAVEFMDSGWSLKHLCGLIAGSATYGQSSHIEASAGAEDPYNRRLARGPRFRVDAEIVRDIALRVSGTLDPTVGGPSVYPPAPKFLFQPPASYGPKVWNEETGSDRYRRGLYTFRFRSVPYPMLETFDAVPGNVACVRRPRSNTPLQALVTLNEPMSMELARRFGRLIIDEGGGDDRSRIEFAMRRAVSRGPTDREWGILNAYLHTQRARLADGSLDPNALVGDPDADEWAAWSLVARALINLDETITKE